MPQGPYRRGAKRRGVAWTAVIKQGLRIWSCTVVDVSKTGARLKLIGTIPLNATVQLACDHFGTLDGIVVWRKGELAGIVFRAPPAEVAAKLGPLLPGLAESGPEQAPPAPRPRFGRRPRREDE